MKRGDFIGLAIVTLLVVGLQVLTQILHRDYYLVQGTMAAYTAVVVMGLGLVMGYAGQVSLGHAAFFAIGGYTSAILTTLDLGTFATTPFGGLLRRLGFIVMRERLFGQESIVSVSPWIAFILALMLTAVVALLVGYPALRLRGHYLAMATLGFGLIVYRLILGSDITGSTDGIFGVPGWTLVPGVRVSGDRAYRVANYYVAWVCALGTLVFILNVVGSRVGRALRSIHGSEKAANAMGVDTARYKLQAFVISAILAGGAGSLMTHFSGGIGPSEAGVLKSVRYVALVAVGGAANVWGGLIVGFGLTFLSLRGCFGSLDDAVFGAVLIAVMTLAPEGPLVPLRRGLRHLALRWLPFGRSGNGGGEGGDHGSA